MLHSQKPSYTIYSLLTTAILIMGWPFIVSVTKMDNTVSNKMERIDATTNTTTYTASTAFIANPERGFYRYTRTDASNYSFLDASYLTGLRENENITLIFRYFVLDNFVNSPLSATYLQNVAQDLNTLRQTGTKGVIRFTYNNDYNGNPPYGDADKATILNHISQLSPILMANSDVIATIQVGFIGVWGEWYYSDHFTPSSTTQGAIDRREVLEALLAAQPANRMVSHRYPEGKVNMYGLNLPADSITINEAYDESTLSRISYHNDCFLAAINDWTYDNNTLGREFAAAESNYYVMGGETCRVSTYSDCATAISDLATYHWSYLNDGYHPTVLSDWGTQGCIDDVTRKLGYRFRLTEATLPTEIGVAEDLTFSLTMANDGWARPYNPRGVELVFRSQTTQAVYPVSIIPTTQDERLWLPGPESTKVLTGTVSIQGIPADDYDILLHMPDPETTLYGNPAYSIQLANQNVWEAATGYNNLSTAITVADNKTAAIFAWLEGPLFENQNQYAATMRTVLFDNGLLPGQTPIPTNAVQTPAGQPYQVAPWNYAGTEGANWTDADYDAIVVETGQKPIDWMLVSFRTGLQKSTEVGRTAGLLLDNGMIYLTDRSVFDGSFPNSVYVVLEHRNHLGIMSAQPATFVDNELTIDFRTADTYTGGAGTGQKEIEPGRWALLAGDGDQSADFPSFEITALDKSKWIVVNGQFAVYDDSDFTFDIDVSGLDKNLWSINNGYFSAVER